MTKDSEVRSEITLEDIATKLFMRYPIFQRDGERKVWEIFRDEDQNKISKILQPRHDAKIILAKYYELKYGIKIVNLKTSKDLEKFQSFVNFKKDTAEAFKIGAILPGAFFDDMPDISELSHCCPILFERMEGESLTAINLDCISRLGSDQQAISSQIMSMADIKISPKNTNILDLNSCHTYAISILKDALRIDGLKDKLIADHSIGSFEYDNLPPELLKITQTQSSIENIDLSQPIIRSNLSKDFVSVAERRERDSETVLRKIEQDEWELDEDEVIWESKTRNAVLWNKANSNVARAKVVLDHYGINSEEELNLFIENLYQEQRDGLSNGNILANISMINNFGKKPATVVSDQVATNNSSKGVIVEK